ncbi:MAG: CmpA/NrtA family ABC transporter substrate-binding protein [Shimia sp.]
MSPAPIPVAYMPLVDAAPLIAAQEMGFAEAEGIALDLIPAPSWSSVRDMLAFGRVDAAHMLSPLPVAGALGLGTGGAAMAALSVLSVNGTVIGVSRVLERRLRDAGHTFAFDDPRAAAGALAQVGQGPITVGVPFPFSMHVALLRYWAAATALGAEGITIRTVPPPLMARALADGDIDAFCVGEPWGSVAVDAGLGALLLPGAAIWSFAPEKVLATRTDWAEGEPDLSGRLLRAVYRAGKWLSDPTSRTTAAELLSRPAYLDMSPEVIDRALTGRLTISPQGEQRHVPGFLHFHDGAATFPWRSQAKWIAAQWGGDPARAHDVFRTDLHRAHLSPLGCDLPGASEKVEGAMAHAQPVASARGELTLAQNRFFDGGIFDPSTPV